MERPDAPGLFDPIAQLEAWNAQEDEREKGQPPRWHPEKTRSLAMFIASPPKAQWLPVLLNACKEWEASSSGMIRFVPCVRPEEADILVEWSDMPTFGRDFEVGHTNKQVLSSNWIKQATITLLKSPEIDKRLSEEQILARLYTTMLHELGHALGLEHSKHSKDVMHHRGWQNKTLSVNDMNQLKALYSKAAPTLFQF